MNIEEVLTIEKFEEWLWTKPATRTVGSIAHIYDCPLANYIKETCHIQSGVNVDAIAMTINRVYYTLPEWAKSFVCSVDSLPTRSGSFCSANEALNTLQRCTCNN